ncbi:MAG: phosphoribosylanthranilate isomerase [Oscillospiraceae bacterium]|nr:phosphoribosylanthranilate isomerase [Oscillospiraceae bacterium]
MSKVKICGVGRAEDVDAVNRALPDYVGFVLAPSRRRVSAAEAAALKERLDPRIATVGVFVNEDIGEVAKIVERGIVDMVQLHGDEDDAYIKRLKEACGCGVIKAIGIRAAVANAAYRSDAGTCVACNSLLQPQPHPQYLPQLPPQPPLPTQPPLPPPPPSADYLLFDALTTSGRRGGAGKAFDWGALIGYAGPPYFLAGGLTAGTVADAIRILSPYCVDVSSGVETDGLKDAAKINQFVHIVREMD